MIRSLCLAATIGAVAVSGTAIAQDMSADEVTGPEMYIADCAVPESPVIPDGAEATLEDVQGAIAGFQSYNEQVSAYQECMEIAVDSSEGEVDTDTRQEWRDLANAEIDKAQDVAEELREQVMIFQEMNDN